REIPLGGPRRRPREPAYRPRADQRTPPPWPYEADAAGGARSSRWPALLTVYEQRSTQDRPRDQTPARYRRSSDRGAAHRETRAPRTPVPRPAAPDAPDRASSVHRARKPRSER